MCSHIDVGISQIQWKCRLHVGSLFDWTGITWQNGWAGWDPFDGRCDAAAADGYLNEHVHRHLQQVRPDQCPGFNHPQAENALQAEPQCVQCTNPLPEEMSPDIQSQVTGPCEDQSMSTGLEDSFPTGSGSEEKNSHLFTTQPTQESENGFLHTCNQKS